LSLNEIMFVTRSVIIANTPNLM